MQPSVSHSLAPRLTLGAIAIALMLTAQDIRPSCNRCSATYIAKDEIEAYFKRAPANEVSDQQVRAVDVGKSHVDIGVIYRGKATAGGAVAEHDLVSEVYYVLDGSATLVTGNDIVDLKRRPPDDRSRSAVERSGRQRRFDPQRHHV